MYRRKVLETLSALRPRRGLRAKKCGAFRDSYINVVHISTEGREDGQQETSLLPQNRHFTVTLIRTNLALSWYLANGIARSLATRPQLGKLGWSMIATKILQCSVLPSIWFLISPDRRV